MRMTMYKINKNKTVNIIDKNKKRTCSKRPFTKYVNGVETGIC